jgi:acyl carrier protein
MSNESATVKFTRDEIERDLIAILTDMTADWDMSFTGTIDPETRLMADLAFESIDVVQLVVAIEGHFQRRHMPFEQLMMVDGRYVQELQVKEISDFLAQQLAA